MLRQTLHLQRAFCPLTLRTLWVPNALNIDSLRLIVDRRLEVFGLVSVHEFGLDTQARKHDLELVVCAAVPRHH